MDNGSAITDEVLENNENFLTMEEEVQRAKTKSGPRLPGGGESEIGFAPLGDRVVILPDEKPDEIHTEAGLVVPQNQSTEPTAGVIVALGPMAAEYLELGLHVVFSPYSGFALRIHGESYKILMSSEIMGVKLSNDHMEME